MLLEAVDRDRVSFFGHYLRLISETRFALKHANLRQHFKAVEDADDAHCDPADRTVRRVKLSGVQHESEMPITDLRSGVKSQSLFK